jgi:hypothetical protein
MVNSCFKFLGRVYDVTSITVVIESRPTVTRIARNLPVCSATSSQGYKNCAYKRCKRLYTTTPENNRQKQAGQYNKENKHEDRFSPLDKSVADDNKESSIEIPQLHKSLSPY